MYRVGRVEFHACFRFLSQKFLKKGMESVDKIKPMVGTMALANGLGKSATIKKRTITAYVRTPTKILRNVLVSHALSNSTRLFRSFISRSSFFICSILSMFLPIKQIFCREKKSVGDICCICKKHDEAVNAHRNSARFGHTYFKRFNKIHVHGVHHFS